MSDPHSTAPTPTDKPAVQPPTTTGRKPTRPYPDWSRRLFFRRNSLGFRCSEAQQPRASRRDTPGLYCIYKETFEVRGSHEQRYPHPVRHRTR